ncbi:YhgE/Pip [Paenibacillus selenitireducens]|uniref:YhgE/Pip n=1 Tax=Paenibacillus selenitireducens TaxID=1324314 RepID=A0A1T2XHV0_9BACL|nr:YhgE/Pip domain-containing protein [Paenibacillus selenitireducens]OPA79461.1 YhgE/Pip [Paenibacillus selenitireducens]
MKKIWTIFWTDIRHICTNIPAAIIITGLIILPSLYAWFNILASWDPYGNTKGIAIAVSNEDEGASILNKKVNIGDEIIASLHENHKIGWTFVDTKKALSGVKHGDYYASIIIPKHFSARIATVISHEPIKAEIDYYVNEKINAISPKITSSGASGIISEVSSNFVKEANGAIFKIFNEVGVELSNELPTIEKVKSLVFKVEKNFPEFERVLNIASSDVVKAQEIVKESQQSLPILSDVASKAQQFSKGVSDLLGYSTQGIEAIAPYVKQDLSSLQEAALSMQELTGVLQDATAGPSAVAKALTHAATRLDRAITISTSVKTWFEHLSQLTHGKLFQRDVDRMNRILTKFKEQRSTVSEIQAAVNRGETVSDTLINRLNTLSKDTSDDLGNIIGRFDSDITPNIVNTINQVKKSTDQVNALLNKASGRIPDISKLLTDASKGLTFGGNEIQTIHKELPTAKSKITDFANKIRDLEQKGDITEIISLLKNNFEKESEFFAQPVVLKENKLFPIPNYGSGMSPFFTTLSLWVGALLLVSLLTVEVHHEGIEYAGYHVYFGRFLTFVTLAMLQSLFDTLGDIYLLKVYVVEKMWFVLFGMFLSIIFMLIVYTLVSIFGNVGKAMAIILLVLQLAGAGGTFPIQVTPHFFQMIHPYLPFTYAISMMREATGGILWDIVWHDVLLMLVFAGIALVLGLALKTPINRMSAGFVKKAKESKIIH